MVLALPLIKILTTSLTIGSGGSGGIFGPGMVIGGFVGLGMWRVMHEAFPGMPTTPAPFVIVGMIACFGSVAHAPLGLMLMVAEMTGSLALLPPAMIAIGLATLVVGDDSIYESQLRSRADSPAHRAAFGLPQLGSVMVVDAMQRCRLALPAATPVRVAVDEFERTGVPGAPVFDDGGKYLGALSRADAERCEADVEVGAVADRSYPAVPSDTRSRLRPRRAGFGGRLVDPCGRRRPRGGHRGDGGDHGGLPACVASITADDRRNSGQLAARRSNSWRGLGIRRQDGGGRTMANREFRTEH